MTSSRPITFNDLITFMVFKPHLPLKPHAHKITIKIFNIKHGGSPRFWFFFAKSTVIWRYFYQVETCNHVDVKACWDFTHELRSTVKNKSWGRVFLFVLFFGLWFWTFTFYNAMWAGRGLTWIPRNPLSAVSKCCPWL